MSSAVGRARASRRGLALSAGVGFALAARVASAHEPFQITTEARALTSGLTLHVTLAGRTATLACPNVVGAERSLVPADLDRFRPELEACARGLYVIRSGGRALEALVTSVSLTEEGDFDARLRYPAAAPGALSFEAVHLARMHDAMFGAELTVTGQREFLGQALLRASTPALTVQVPGSARTSPAEAPPSPSFGAYLRLGVEHISSGFDHLAFLLGLVAVCTRVSTVLAAVTAFTLAHSVTLALAALGVVTLPSRVVEPLIAVTIVAVAVENLWHGEDARRRFVLAFVFGLVHGFGFAGALVRSGLGRRGAPLALPLFAFNLGVELGQAGVVALVLPLLFALRRLPAFERQGARVLSVLVGVAGCAWLIERLG